MIDMREKKWIDCPACGAKKSMRKKKSQEERFNPSGYPPLDVSGLDGQFCESCGEGFWSLESERLIARLLAEHMAQHDATRVVAAELASVQEAAKAMHVTVQGVHKMMREGRLRYVVAGGSRLPIRRDLTEKAKARQHASA
jgi:YgiT-type zinc finger domain-containing protein